MKSSASRSIREGHERFEVQIQEHVKAQVSLVSKEIEDGMDRLEATLERLFKFQVGSGLSSNTDKGIVDPPLLQVSSVKPNASKGIDGVPVTSVVNEKIEVNQSEGRNQYHAEQDYRAYLPETPFPKFDGTDPAKWVMRSELYFDLYQIPEVYKTRWAAFHFSGTAIEWYRGVKVDKEHPPWAVLKEMVMEGFKNWGEMNPAEEFKRLYQTGSVKEYIRSFERAMWRLLCEHPSISNSKSFFVSSFICGLKEEIRYMVDMFEPSTRNDAFHRAINYEKHLSVNLEVA